MGANGGCHGSRGGVLSVVCTSGYVHECGRTGEVAKLPAKPTASGFFRAGQAGTWRTALSQEEQSTVESIAGELLRDLGYETTVPLMH